MWNIVKTEINNKDKNIGPPLHIEGNPFNDYQDIANIFNAYFVNSANNNHADILTIKHRALNYLYKVYAKPFPQIKLTPASTKEICEIIL